MAIAIRVDHVSKHFNYRVEKFLSVKTALVNLLNTRKFFATERELDVLKNVSFEIQQGEFVGIMGRNGAGKSTMLKLICGIYRPNSGRIEVNGTIAPLIEIGAGFHPHLTGYENIFLNAAILGFDKDAVNEKVQQIIEFADLGEHIDMPVRKYSNGMVVRLGFSIATHLEAPILLADEVLSVGDVGFQKKCLDKISDIHRAGRTVVLVTHDPAQVVEHCARCIVIENAQKIYDGEPVRGAQVYLETVTKKP